MACFEKPKHKKRKIVEENRHFNECWQEEFILFMKIYIYRYRGVLQILEDHAIDINKIVSITTDGAPSMFGKHKGFTALMKSNKDTRNDMICYHCIVHQENLAALKNDIYSIIMIEVITVVILSDPILFIIVSSESF